MASPTQWTMSLSKLLGMLKDRETWHAAVHGVSKCQATLKLNNNVLADKLRQIEIEKVPCKICK